MGGLVLALASPARAQSAEPVLPTPAETPPVNEAACPVNAESIVLAADGLARTRAAVARGKVTILAVGSSSIAGWGASAYERGFVPLLQTDLRRRLPGVQVDVVNRGVGGETARETVDRLGKELADHRPDLVIWQVGTNDVMRARPWNDVAADMQRGEAVLTAAAVDVLLIDPQRLPPDEVNVNTRGRNAQLGEAARMIALEGDRVGYAVQRRFDAMAAWTRLTRGGVGPDDLHLNDEGYACWAAITGEALAAALR
ncbi:hypothetical protein ASG17_08505 [Brevundimonas sp. Leaf363]|uniref:SGNH/GDSL hydrolase family protein n=1 Tax=Brevundimonas sp. Leaf363 TaxID=1736353 RepID=UPI0006F9604F|nr:SGNH/GDSL hydrolase family protein [Brevundimonas sp. Leaf363]KQS56067.1 hypothetical protein ASG17_08505 [Brevundimonas sp. Leaf363]